MPDTIEHIQTIAQPIEVSVKVGMEIDSKGQKKPSVEIKITEHLTEAVSISTVVENALRDSLNRCKDTIKKAMED